jgi:hypothetical protein
MGHSKRNLLSVYSTIYTATLPDSKFVLSVVLFSRSPSVHRSAFTRKHMFFLFATKYTG